MNISDPRRPWIPASTHSDPELFRKRMREWIAKAQAQKQPATKVTTIPKRQAQK